jgi:endonuclease III
MAASSHKLLEQQVTPADRFDAHVLLVLHGRSTCRNRNPACSECPHARMCPEAHIASDRRADYVIELRR